MGPAWVTVGAALAALHFVHNPGECAGLERGKPATVLAAMAIFGCDSGMVIDSQRHGASTAPAVRSIAGAC